MSITGHLTPEMENRYNTVDAQDKRVALDRMTAFLETASLESVDQTVDQRWN